MDSKDIRIMELEDALLDMVIQFSAYDNKMKHSFMSAEENAYRVLGIEYGESIKSVIDRLNEKYKSWD